MLLLPFFTYYPLTFWVHISNIVLPIRWPISACHSYCHCSNTPCLTFMRFLSSMRRSWHAATLMPASRLCLWTKPTSKYPHMLPWASSRKHEIECVPDSLSFQIRMQLVNLFVCECRDLWILCINLEFLQFVKFYVYVLCIYLILSVFSVLTCSTVPWS